MRRAPILLASLAAGTQALLAQTLLLREHLVLYGGNEVAVGAFLGAWLAGIVVGALGATRWLPRLERWTLPLLVAQGLLPTVAIVLARTARGLSGVPPYEPFPLTLVLLWSIPIAVPVSLATGALVPSLAARARSTAEDVTGIYAAEAVGALLGGIGATAALVAGVDPATLTALCAAIGCAGGVPLAVRRWLPAAAAAAIVLVALAFGPSIGAALRGQTLGTALPGATLLDHAESPSASLWLAELRNLRVLLVDGEIVAAFPDPERVELRAGQLAALTRAPRRLLIIGTQGVDLLPALPALTGIERVAWLVRDPGVAEIATRHVPGVATNPSLEIVIGDPMQSQPLLAGRGPFDAIWLLVDTPSRRSDDLYLTRETLKGLTELLTPRGVLAIPVTGGDNYVGPRLRLALGTIVAGVAANLEHVRLMPGADGLVLGARDRIDLTAGRLASDYASLAPEPPRLDRDRFASLLDPERIAEADELLESMRSVEASSLDQPLALFHNLLVRAEREDVHLARAIENLRHSAAIAWLPLAVLALFALAGIAGSPNPTLVLRNSATATLAIGGVLGMGLNLVLLHHYQGRFGTVYVEVGWLFGVWMAGLAGGALSFRRWCRTNPNATLPGILAFGALALLATGLTIADADLFANRLTAATLFVTAGVLSGAVVPVAEAMLSRTGILGARAGSIIQAADHLGGAACAVGVGVVLVPILGLRHTTWLLAAIGWLGVATISVAAARQRFELPRLVSHRLHGPASFPFPRLVLLLFAVSTAAWVGRVAYQHFLRTPAIELSAADLNATGLSPPWQQGTTPVHHYIAADGVALASAAAEPVQGFGGAINLRVAIDTDGRIRQVGFLEHHETPAYIDDAPRLLEALRGLDATRPIELAPATPDGQVVDGITGATVTSAAVVRAVRGVGRALSEPVFGVAYPSESSRFDPSDPRFWYLLVGLLLVLPVAMWAPRTIRRVWLVVHVAIGGLWLGVQLSTVQVFSWLRLDPDLDPSSATGLLALVVVLSAAFGPLYCGYLCPAGALQEIVGWLGGARRLPDSEGPRFVKYTLLAIMTTLAFGLGWQSVERIDLLREAWTANRSLLVLAAILLVGSGCLVVVRFGCRFLCPTGAALSLLNKVAPLARLLPAKKFGACDLGVTGPHDVDCLQCNRCRLEKRADPAGSARHRLVRVLWVGAIVVLVLSVLSARPDTTTRHSVQPNVRAVDPAVIRNKISTGELSDREAEYWHETP